MPEQAKAKSGEPERTDCREPGDEELATLFFHVRDAYGLPIDSKFDPVRERILSEGRRLVDGYTHQFPRLGRLSRAEGDRMESFVANKASDLKKRARHWDDEMGAQLEVNRPHLIWMFLNHGESIAIAAQEILRGRDDLTRFEFVTAHSALELFAFPFWKAREVCLELTGQMGLEPPEAPQAIGPFANFEDVQEEAQAQGVDLAAKAWQAWLDAESQGKWAEVARSFQQHGDKEMAAAVLGGWGIANIPMRNHGNDFSSEHRAQGAQQGQRATNAAAAKTWLHEIKSHMWVEFADFYSNRGGGQRMNIKRQRHLERDAAFFAADGNLDWKPGSVDTDSIEKTMRREKDHIREFRAFLGSLTPDNRDAYIRGHIMWASQVAAECERRLETEYGAKIAGRLCWLPTDRPSKEARALHYKWLLTRIPVDRARDVIAQAHATLSPADFDPNAQAPFTQAMRAQGRDIWREAIEAFIDSIEHETWIEMGYMSAQNTLPAVLSGWGRANTDLYPAQAGGDVDSEFVSEIFLRIRQAWSRERFVGPAPYGTIPGQAANAIRKRFRRKDGEVLSDDFVQAAAAPEQTDPEAAALLAEQIQQALGQLSTMERKVMARALDDWSDREIAEDLEIAPATVRVHLHRARKKVRSAG